MKKIYTLTFLSLSFNLFSQDKNFLQNGEIISSKIIEVSPKEVKYNKFNNIEGPLYIEKKGNISKIEFENGNIEKLDLIIESNDVSIEETKAFIIENINIYGFEEDSYSHPYKAVFEGDFLRLIEMNKKRTKQKNSGILFDFSNVYKFQKVSKRSDDKAFINIFVSIQESKRRNTWDKHKLVMLVKGHEKAESILKALIHYNKLLSPQKMVEDKF
ncbi:hypothetical protein [Flavobacterium laiguense]|uniref:Uncharacterized protein n=1 Tax=Flavobacterium laiguense TaxID=2169409 RepID=A0A2U1K2Y9_9FLAO|nr:hypothetical protein [Flavobacterium laiguense]PWA11615.1 hypothetical protein DB891_02065 [Flavobacterium laiguense]